MVARDDERSLLLARRGMLAGGLVALGLVAASIWTLLGISSGDESSVAQDPVPAVVAVPAELAVDGTEDQSDSDQSEDSDGPPVAVQQAEFATVDDLNQMISQSLDWAPDLETGASVVEFSITNIISDGGGETFGIADNFSGVRGLRGGETNNYLVREGELVLVQRTPSGWPDPEIVCDDGNAWTRVSAVFLTMRIGPPVSCTITNTRDADSLSVLSNDISCDGIIGRVQGPEPPFFVNYQLNPDVDSGAAFSPVLAGPYRIDAVGEFFVPYWMIEQVLVHDSYQLTVTTQDFSGSQITLTDAATFDPRPCS